MTASLRDEIDRLELLQAAHPTGRVFTHLAEAYRKAGDFARARETVERGLEQHADFSNAHLVRGRILLALGEQEEAETAFRRVLSLDPENRATLRILADLARDAGRRGEARDYYRELLLLAPEDQAVHAQLRALEVDGAGPAGGAEANGVPAVGISLSAPSSAEPPATTPALAPEPAPTRPVRGYLHTLLAARPRRALPAPAPAINGRGGERSVPAAGGALVSSGAAAGTVPARPKVSATVTRGSATALPATPTLSGQAVIQLVDLLTGLLEYRDPFFRGGSSLTRLVAVAIGRELGLGERELANLALAAVLRDLGRLALGGRLVKHPRPDLGPEARRRIEDHVPLGLQLLEGIDLPPEVLEAIRHHHERWDGQGYPDGLKGEAIPLPARILAVADSLAAMISPRPYRLPRRIDAVIEELRQEGGTRYDPAVVDALLHTLPGQRRRSPAFGLRHYTIVVDADQPRATILAAKLCSHGYVAEAIPDLDLARERMKRIPVELLILSGNAVEGEADARLAEFRDDDRTANLPIVIMDAGPTEQRVALLEAGADLCFPGAIAFGELQASLSALMKRTVRPTLAPPAREAAKPAATTWYALQGELRDFPLSWLLQVLTYDARTAAILIQERGNEGAIYLEQGVARHAWTRATWTNQSWTRMATGEDALRQMLRWSGGSFVVRPEERTPEQTIHRSLMHLLLDAAVADDHGRANAIFGTVDAEE